MTLKMYNKIYILKKALICIIAIIWVKQQLNQILT